MPNAAEHEILPINLRLLLQNFPALHVEHENFSANKYENFTANKYKNANYWHF